MTTDYRQQIQQLWEQAEGTPFGPVKVALIEEAVRLADSQQDTDLAYGLRHELVVAATFSGAPEKALVAFTWRLARYDEHPERYDENELLWHYKWIAESLPSFYQLSRAQVADSLNDMERRYQRADLSLSPVWKERARAATHFGDPAEAREAYRRWQAIDRGAGSDCKACDVDFQVEYLAFAGEPAQAVACAAPILAGRLRCGKVPHTTLGTVLLPLLRLGQVEEAAKCHRKGYRLVETNRDFLLTVAQHLTFLALTDNFGPALRVLEKHLVWALETAALDGSFELYLGARLLLERLRDGGTASVTLRLPASFAAYREDDRYETASLARWFDDACQDLATRFDTRSGNDYRRRRTHLDELKGLATPYALKGE
jgi:hypothetical protein